MSCPINQESIQKLKLFVDICSANPDILCMPDLAFFRNFIESLGGKIPQPSKRHTEEATNKPPQAPTEEADDVIESDLESDLELDTDGCVDPDKLDDKQTMGDANKEVTEEDNDKADEKRMEAVTAFSESDYEKAIELYTEAIELNPQSALVFAKRGQVYLKLTKPNACIKDCTKALELNPDSAAAYKFRGRAFRLLGEWEKSAQDLRQACNIDFDEQIDEWLKEVTPNAKKIEQHKLKLERKKYEKDLRESKERFQKEREARGGTASATPPPPSAPSDGIPTDPSGFLRFLQDPEIMEALKDPEVANAFMDITSNPMNFSKYQTNPKIAAIMAKITSKFAGAGMQFPFPNPGGFPGAGAGTTGGDAGPKATSPDDDNLD